MKFITKAVLFLTALLYLGDSYCQVMSTTSYRDTSLPRIDVNPSQYGFIYPVNKDFYTNADFTPPTDGRFFVQNYGPRTLGNYDNHQGSDIWGHTVADGVLTLNPPALCMCDGTIKDIIDGTDAEVEASSPGRKIRIECDNISQVFNSPINIIFLHLDSIVASLAEEMSVSKGDTLGFVGASGYTSLSHLHFDYTGIPNQWGNTTSRKYLNPMRLFDPEVYPEVVGKLDNAHIEILHDWADSTLIRIHWPHNQHINRYEFSNGDYNLVYDVEEMRASYPIFEPSIWARDSMKIFPYRTNGFYSALYYETDYEYPAYFPNSPLRDANLAMYGFEHIPLTADTVVNVYDFMLEDVPPAHLLEDWVVKLTDVWGYTVEGTLAVLPVEFIDFTVESQADKQVNINWTTGSEQNNDYFIIEKSKDALHYEELAKITAASNSTSRKTYQHTDVLPFAGTSYYRIKQVDFDKKTSYSEIRKIYLNKSKPVFKIYPNPSTDMLLLEFESVDTTKALKVYDSSGQLILTQKVSNHKHSIDISQLAIGVYYISYEGQNLKFNKN